MSVWRLQIAELGRLRTRHLEIRRDRITWNGREVKVVVGADRLWVDGSPWRLDGRLTPTAHQLLRASAEESARLRADAWTLPPPAELEGLRDPKGRAHERGVARRRCRRRGGGFVVSGRF